jgi:glycosyltransferase involved in cell wall biosynthesis
MRIIHLILGKANPNRMNGVNRVVHNLATAQAALGEDVSVWGITNPDTDTGEIERSYKTKWFRPSKWPFTINTELSKAILDCSNTCFHLHGGFIPVYYNISKVINKSNCDFVLTPHGTYTEGAMAGNKMVKQIYFRLFEQYVIFLKRDMKRSKN